jgi:hypothetical protein
VEQKILNRKMAVFWDVAPFRLVEVDRRFRGAAGGSINCPEILASVKKLLFVFWVITSCGHGGRYRQ